MSSCNEDLDPARCSLAEGMSQFEKVFGPGGKDAYSVVRSQTHDKWANLTLELLRKSPSIQRMGGYLGLARQAVGKKRICEPVLVMIPEEPVFGFGFGFSMADYYSLDGGDGGYYPGILHMESAHFLGKDVFTPMTFIKKGYLEPVIIHELAHKLFQDLYGVYATGDLITKNSHSREGHMASLVTDPTLAWAEGFAEGFEAYFSEGIIAAVGSDQETASQTPHLDHYGHKLYRKGLDLYLISGKDAYRKALPSLLKELSVMILKDLDEVMLDFIKLERQITIRDGLYVMKGQNIDLAYRYGLEALLSDVEDELLESGEALISKEGVSAFIIYSFLKTGQQELLFEVIQNSKPKNLADFVGALRKRPSLSLPTELENAFKAVFTQAGREATREHWRRIKPVFSQNDQNTGTLFFSRLKWQQELSQIAALGLFTPGVLSQEDTLPEARDFWIEFASPDLSIKETMQWAARDPFSVFSDMLRRAQMGRLDRIHALIVPDHRLMSFIRTIELPKSLTDQINKETPNEDNRFFRIEEKQLQVARTFGSASSSLSRDTVFEDLVIELVRRSDRLEFTERKGRPTFHHPEMKPMADYIRAVSNKLLEARKCFLDKCLSNY